MNFLRVACLGLLLCSTGTAIRAGVVINEIFYNAPNEIQELQFVELYNATDQPADLSGWKLAKGIDFQFPPDTTLAAQGFLVLARDAERFKEAYGFAPDGIFKGLLSHKGMRIDLVDRRGKKVDRVQYKDEAPWPTAADGYSASLERICPTADGERAENWAASALHDEMQPSGTPKKPNGHFSAVLPPVIKKVKASPANPAPRQAITVEAEVRDPKGVKEVTCRYRLAGAGGEQAEVSLPMTSAGDGKFSAQIPGQEANQLVRFRVSAVNLLGARRDFPREEDPRPAMSCFVHEPFESAKIPLALILNVDGDESKSIEKHLRAPNQRGFSEEDQMRMFARMQLESGLDLAPLWFALAGRSPLSFEQVAQLRPILTNQLAARTKLISDFAEAGDIKERMKAIPDTVKSFHAKIGEAVKPMLNEPQNKELAQVQQAQVAAAAAGPTRYTPDLLLKRLLNLEGTFLKLTARADVTEPTFKQVVSLYQASFQQRSDLTNAAQALLQGQGDFDDLRDKIEKINGDLAGQLKPILTADQQKEWNRGRQEGESFMPGQGRAKAPRRPQGRSAFVFVNPQATEPELFDFVTVTERNAGLNVHFQKDRLFQAMSTVNVLFESNDRFVLAEPMAYELYRLAGNAAPLAGYMRLKVDGKAAGYYEWIEQPNRSFLQRNRLKGDGNLYKMLWYERGVEGQHQKKTNRQLGHEDVVELVDQLEKTKNNPDEQWAVIKKHFNVEQVINYFAINTCLSHWDGFFNNYFTYHDAGGTGRWEMYPWDQDKTWGFYDGLNEGDVFYDMPITFGMEGDRPPGWPKDRPAPRGFGGGSNWWRPGGYFSKPLLANPHFRKHFLARTREILETIYTEENFFPRIDAQGDRLKEEVRLRATILNQNPDQATQTLQRNLQSLKDHLTKRRKFLLEQDEIRTAGKFARAELK